MKLNGHTELHIKWAQSLDGKPSCIPNSRPRGAKAAGLRYERSLHSNLPAGTLHGQWFEYICSEGRGYCQTDFIVSLLPACVAVLEAKYTLVPGAFSKLLSLYIPVVTLAMQCPAIGIVVVKNLNPAFIHTQPIYNDLYLAAKHAHNTGMPALLHWVGQPLITRVAA